MGVGVLHAWRLSCVEHACPAASLLTELVHASADLLVILLLGQASQRTEDASSPRLNREFHGELPSKKGPLTQPHKRRRGARGQSKEKLG